MMINLNRGKNRLLENNKKETTKKKRVKEKA